MYQVGKEIKRSSGRIKGLYSSLDQYDLYADVNTRNARCWRVSTHSTRMLVDMSRLTTGIRSEKCVVRRFCRANVYLYKPRYYSLLHTYAVWCSLLLLGSKPVQHVTVLYAVGNCNTMVLWYYTGWFKKMDSVSYVCISWTIHGMWMIYISFERGGPKFSNTTARALA